MYSTGHRQIINDIQGLNTVEEIKNKEMNTTIHAFWHIHAVRVI